MERACWAHLLQPPCVSSVHCMYELIHQGLTRAVRNISSSVCHAARHPGLRTGVPLRLLHSHAVLWRGRPGGPQGQSMVPGATTASCMWPTRRKTRTDVHRPYTCTATENASGLFQVVLPLFSVVKRALNASIRGAGICQRMLFLTIFLGCLACWLMQPGPLLLSRPRRGNCCGCRCLCCAVFAASLQHLCSDLANICSYCQHVKLHSACTMLGMLQNHHPPHSVHVRSA